MSEQGYAVVDVETTGLFPCIRDRVIELAVVHLDVSGRVTGRWHTLVNPLRDLGRQELHGIRPADAAAAPTFDEIAPRLVELLSGRVLVAHNAQFGADFLLRELERIDYGPVVGVESVCTMQLAREFLPGAGRSLADCCAAYDIVITDAHHALADAIATAALLEAYLLGSPGVTEWDDALARAAAAPWPAIDREGAAWLPRDEEGASEGERAVSFLERVTAKLPDFTGPDEHLEYLALLDLALLGRELSAHDATALVRLAELNGIDRRTCAELHARYFDDLAQVVWAEGNLTADEQADLDAVARMLGIGPDAVAAALVPRPHPDDIESVLRLDLKRGDIVVLTGEMARARVGWRRELIARGFAVGDAVTRRTRLLVAADPASPTGKARKARDYGIPIVSEFGLRSLIGVA